MQVGKSMPGRRNSEGKGAAETGLRPRDLPQAWSSATSFSHGTDGPALHPGFGSRFPGCPVQSGGVRGGGEGCLLCLLLGCGLSVGVGPGGGHHGSPPIATQPARHLPKKTLLPTPPLRPVPATRGTGLPGWTLLRSAFSHCLSSAASGSASGSRKAGVPLSAAFRALHRFLGGEEIWGGIWAYPKPEQHGVPFCKPVCRWKLQCSFLLPYSEYSFCFRTHAEFHIHNGV